MKQLPFASLIVALAGTPALAQVYVEDPDDDIYIEERERAGIGLTLGGGVSGFTQDIMRDTTTDGGDWGARLTFGTRSPVALEASYIGSAQAIDALGLDDDAVLLSNGVQGVVRLNAGFQLMVDPFIFGGMAWRRYDLVNTDTNTSAIDDDDDVIEFPVGLGVAGKYRGLLVDLRGEFRYSTEEDMVPEIENRFQDAAMHRWGVNLTFGYEI